MRGFASAQPSRNLAGRHFTCFPPLSNELLKGFVNSTNERAFTTYNNRIASSLAVFHEDIKLNQCFAGFSISLTRARHEALLSAYFLVLCLFGLLGPTFKNHFHFAHPSEVSASEYAWLPVKVAGAQPIMIIDFAGAILWIKLFNVCPNSRELIVSAGESLFWSGTSSKQAAQVLLGTRESRSSDGLFQTESRTQILDGSQLDSINVISQLPHSDPR